MKMLKSLVFKENGDGTILTCDTIEYQGTMWLVPHWVDFEKEGVSKPVRLIRLDRFQHQKVKFGIHDFVLNEAIPSDFFETLPPKQIPSRFVVIEAPDLSVPMSSRTQGS